MALERGLELWRPASINAPEVLDDLRDAHVGALCVAGYGQLFKSDVLAGWPCINVHFSLLPAYRGAAPVERALMDGVAVTGVTIMRMEAGLDTGPIIAKATRHITADDDAGILLHDLAVSGGDLLADVLDHMTPGQEPVSTSQPAEGVSHAAKIVDDDMRLDLQRSPQQVVDQIRALSPHIGAKLVIGGESFKIWRAAVADVARQADQSGWIEAGRLFLPCGDGVIEVLEIQPPSRSRMPTDAFARGWRGGLDLAA
jgi:methionyl-tRNA formyltransferase